MLENIRLDLMKYLPVLGPISFSLGWVDGENWTVPSRFNWTGMAWVPLATEGESHIWPCSLRIVIKSRNYTEASLVVLRHVWGLCSQQFIWRQH